MSQLNRITANEPSDLLKERLLEGASAHRKAGEVQSSSASYAEPACVRKIAILLCTYHGQHFLADQLDSFAAQTYTNWEVWASDDGSLDDTHAILKAYQQKWGKQRLSMHSGPAQGFAANFLSLSCDVDIVADYFAYSDQDDIWEVDKLQRAVEWLRSVPAGIPALYCSRALLVDIDNQPIGLSPLFKRMPNFSNSLIQSIGGGNTMVFNDAARALLRKAGKDVVIVSHDCWAYMVVSGCGGKVFYDACPTVRYRQHDGNLVGTNISYQARWSRLTRLWNGWFRSWNDRNIESLQRLQSSLTPENKRILDDFSIARQTWFLPRLWLFARSGVRRQSILGNFALFVAAVFNKI
ncbi:glycosyltransferase family 2 protein [Janthinobacterium sp. GB4P2]|uniref:glycosyltransferase family 2 protein n=1 Tax=Janthinobacterium sp. GB4P2 TaxID=3424189 RepID=UPI003F1FF5C2